MYIKSSRYIFVMLKANKENKIGIILVSETKPDYSFAAHRFYINGFITPSRLDGKQKEKVLSPI